MVQSTWKKKRKKKGLIRWSRLRFVSIPFRYGHQMQIGIHLAWWMYIKHGGSVGTLQLQTGTIFFGICYSSYWNECTTLRCIILHTEHVFHSVYFWHILYFCFTVLWFFLDWNGQNCRQTFFWHETQQLLFENRLFSWRSVCYNNAYNNLIIEKVVSSASPFRSKLRNTETDNMPV